MKRTIDDILNLCDSRYTLVNAVSAKARELADSAELHGEPMSKKPVITVLDNLKAGRYTIARQGERASLYRSGGFEVTISRAEEEEYM